MNYSAQTCREHSMQRTLLLDALFSAWRLLILGFNLRIAPRFWAMPRIKIEGKPPEKTAKRRESKTGGPGSHTLAARRKTADCGRASEGKRQRLIKLSRNPGWMGNARGYSICKSLCVLSQKKTKQKFSSGPAAAANLSDLLVLMCSVTLPPPHHPQVLFLPIMLLLNR